MTRSGSDVEKRITTSRGAVEGLVVAIVDVSQTVLLHSSREATRAVASAAQQLAEDADAVSEDMGRCGCCGSMSNAVIYISASRQSKSIA